MGHASSVPPQGARWKRAPRVRVVGHAPSVPPPRGTLEACPTCPGRSPVEPGAIGLFVSNPFAPASPLAETGVLPRQARAYFLNVLDQPGRPSATEIMTDLERDLGLGARWGLPEAMDDLVQRGNISVVDREYLDAMISTGALDRAMRGADAPDPAAISSIDQLLQASAVYRSTDDFRDMIAFMGRFRAYSAYNNMLIRLQNPSCGYYATVKTWKEQLGRWPKQDARPMLILAPMHPVLIV